MKKSTFSTICLLLVVFVAFMMVMRSYELDLVHGIVLNTLIQKGENSYSAQKVRETLHMAREVAEHGDRTEDYLDKLLSLSQRLEKIQKLSRDEMDAILSSFRQPVEP
ncbi:MAG: hypothetical protein VYA53_07805 [Acidobacteriota bacterium]|nr:hypothetical protein [Acidobacteriota bacterium]